MTEEDANLLALPKRSHFQPADWIAGQRHRRRLTRRSGSASSLPRSNTTPVLNMRISSSRDMAMSTVFHGYNPPTEPPASAMPASVSPTSMADTDDRKKRHVLDLLKSKGRSESSHTSEPVVTSPLPPLTPKAAKMLGVAYSENDNIGHGQRRQVQPDSDDERVEMRPIIHRKSSFQWLNSSQTSIDKQTRFKENMDEADLPATPSTHGRFKKLRQESGKKAMHMLDLMQPRSKSLQRGADPGTSSRSPQEEHDTDVGYSSDSEIFTLRRPATRLPQVHKRKSRIRKKGPKSLERMSPITEASLSEDGVVIEDYSDSPVLEAISEDERPRYVLDDEELSPAEDYEHDSQQWATRNASLRPPQNIKLQTELQGIERPETVYVKSPLQRLENMLLDNQDQRTTVLEEHGKLEMSHDQMKRRLRDIETRSIIQDEPNSDILFRYEHDGRVHNDGIDGDVDVPIGSDIDTDEELTIEMCPLTTIRRIPLGMVNLVDIPPRKPANNVSQPKKDCSKVNVANFLKRGGTVVMGNPHSLLAERPQDRFTSEQKERFPGKGVHNNIPVNVHSNADLYSFPDYVDSKLLSERKLPPPPLPKDHIKHQWLINGHMSHLIDPKRTLDRTAINELQVSPYLRTPTRIKQEVVGRLIYCQKCAFGVNGELWKCSIQGCNMVAICRHCAMDMDEEWQESN